MPILMSVGIPAAVTQSVSWVTEMMKIFTTAPAVYFVGFAIIGAAAGVARKFVPMKRR